MKFREIELKYNADDITLELFHNFCKDRKPKEFFIASGFDYFYADTKGSDSFARHRISPVFNQLTFKRKTTDRNNFIRTEHNITLGLETTPEQTQALCKEFGYELNTSIFKNAFIYKYDTYTLVYYVVYSAQMTELGRFIEIEMDEDHPWESDDHAWEALTHIESGAKLLGISPQRRVKKSLFEQFKK